MPPCKPALACFLVFLCALPWLSARAAPGNTPAIVLDGLGHATIPLDGPWQFHTGDEPSYASPAFDDSHWEQIVAGKSWEEQGHFNYTGFAWYRRHLVVAPGTPPDLNLALLLSEVGDSCEVYWNGKLVGGYGKVPPHAVWYWFGALPRLSVLGPAQSGTLAIRVWRAPVAYGAFVNWGGLGAVPLAGSPEAAVARVSQARYGWLKSNLYSLTVSVLTLAVSLLVLLAWLRDRNQWMLLWLGLYLLRPFVLFVVGLPGVSFRLSYGTIGFIYSATDATLWLLLLYLLRLRDDARLVRWTRIFAAVTVAFQFAEGAEQLFDWTLAPRFFLLTDVVLTIPCLVLELYGLVLIGFAVRKRLDASLWSVAISAALAQAWDGASSFTGLGQRWTHWTLAQQMSAFGFSIAGNHFGFDTLADTFLLVSLLYAAWRYTHEQSLRQTALEQDYRSAQELQQLLIPSASPEVPGYAVTSAYIPAQQVGGDFYQLIPLPDDRTMLVIGDVSGKGLRAAMAVAMIVGAVRTAAEITEDPAALIESLNRRLQGRLRGGFATCLALRLDPDGTCILANAGHLPPFLNGQELPLPPALPLGLVADEVYDSTRIVLAPGDRLTLYTDGLLEARNGAGELFGFERTRAISSQPASAIAQAAQAFGQDDDITVLTISLVPVEAAGA